MELPPEVSERIRAMDVWEWKGGANSISVARIEYAGSELNLEGAVDGSISEIRRTATESGFTSTKSAASVDGLAAKRVEIKCLVSGTPIIHHGIVFAERAKMWQVQVIGEASQERELNALSDTIFESIRVIR